MPPFSGTVAAALSRLRSLKRPQLAFRIVLCLPLRSQREAEARAEVVGVAAEQAGAVVAQAAVHA